MYIKIGEVAKQVGVTTQTIRLWEEKGVLEPVHRNHAGTRFYTQEQVDKHLGVEKKDSRKAVGYCRVSSPSQKDDLVRQVEDMTTYLKYRWDEFEIIEDIGSGLNYEKRGLQKLIDKIVFGEIHTIVVMYKDRLLRFGFEILEYLAKLYNVKIKIVEENEEKSDSEELAEDIVNIITVYSARLNGRRAWENRRRREEQDDG